MFKKKNVCLIISIVLAVLWLLISMCVWSDTSADLESDDFGTSVGTAIGMALLMPYMVTASVGTILHIIGGFTYRKGLTLAGLIVECVAILFSIMWGFGYIPVIIFGFIGYSKMRKEIE